MERLLDRDPISGVSTYFRPSDDGKSFDIRYHQDCEGLIEENKKAQNDAPARPVGDFHHVAEIPVGIQYKWMVEKGVDVHNREHWPAVRRLLNDPEWRYLKRAPLVI